MQIGIAIDDFFWSDAVMPLLAPAIIFSVLALVCYLLWHRSKPSRKRKRLLLFGATVVLSLMSIAFYALLILDLWFIAGWKRS